MAKLPPAPDDEESEVADVTWLVEEALCATPSPAKPTPYVPTPARPAPLDPAPVDEYAVVGGDDLADDIAPPPRKPKPRRDDDSPLRAPPEPSATVDQVWSRWAEWGGTLLLLAIVALAEAFLLFLAFSAGLYPLMFLLVLLSGTVLIALCYPIFITLERPVRITPEQAVKDFYAALSHALPHYRRMWLLLSSAGRSSGQFSSFGGFKACWAERHAALRGTQGGRWPPLRFEVADFQSDKSAGQTALDAKFTLNVFLGDKQDKPPLQSYWIKMGLVKGPDRMWYLNKGTLPSETNRMVRKQDKL